MVSATKYRINAARFDAVKVRPCGSVIADMVSTEVGVFGYAQPDGSVVNEFRPPEVVGDPESLSSMALVPFTNNHPAELLTTETIKDHQTGTVGETNTFDAATGLVHSKVVLTDQGTIADLQNGKIAVSMGYDSVTVPFEQALDIPSVAKSPGVWNGKPYTHVQRKIIYNHGSLVEKGRAPRAGLRLDAAIGVDHMKTKPKTDAEGAMQTVTLPGGMSIEVPETAAVVISMLMSMSGATAETAVDELSAKKPMEVSPPEDPPMDSPTGEPEAPPKMDSEKVKLQARLDAITKDRDEWKAKAAKVEDMESQKKFDQAVAARVALEDAAATLAKMDRSDFRGKSDSEVRTMALEATGVKLDGKSAEYVATRFDVAIDMAKDQGLQTLASTVASPRKDSAPPTTPNRPNGMGPLTISKKG